jgi:hypothetical protein
MHHHCPHLNAHHHHCPHLNAHHHHCPHLNAHHHHCPHLNAHDLRVYSLDCAGAAHANPVINTNTRIPRDPQGGRAIVPAAGSHMRSSRRVTACLRCGHCREHHTAEHCLSLARPIVQALERSRLLARIRVCCFAAHSTQCRALLHARAHSLQCGQTRYNAQWRTHSSNSHARARTLHNTSRWCPQHITFTTRNSVTARDEQTNQRAWTCV